MIDSERPTDRTAAGILRFLDSRIKLDAETGFYLILILAAIVTRFFDLETRVMSHDESLHSFYSWQLREGIGFKHNPMIHGPLQFYFVALSYFIFGDTDASSRFPAAFAGVLSIVLVAFFRRWLGKSGTVLAVLLMVVSPYMLYYSRYVRNEALIVPLALLSFYALFRYFEQRQLRWLILLTASMALHFAVKETAYIYFIQFVIFLILFLSWRFFKNPEPEFRHKIVFLGGLTLLLVGIGVSLFTVFRDRNAGHQLTQFPGPSFIYSTYRFNFSPYVSMGLSIALAGFLLMFFILRSCFRSRVREEFPSLDLLLLIGAVSLPLWAALPSILLGWNPLSYSDPIAFRNTQIVIWVLLAVGMLIGLLWDWRRWLIVSGVFYGIFTVLFTTFFTNSAGMITGFVGSLGYWLGQHAVERGSQPWYYYLMVQIPIYEYLAATGLAFSVLIAVLTTRESGKTHQGKSTAHTRGFPAIGFLIYWAVTSVGGYSFFGEKMPWLTVHIILPMIMLSGWAIGRLIDDFEWRLFSDKRTYLIPPLLIVIFFTAGKTADTLLNSRQSYLGVAITHKHAIVGFLAVVFIGVVSVIVLFRWSQGWRLRHFAQLSGMLFFTILLILTVRTAFRAAYRDYDQATEFMVYAHSTQSVKTVLDRVEDLSRRAPRDSPIRVGFDDDVAWPFRWYLRDQPSLRYDGANPPQDLSNLPFIIVGEVNFARIGPLLEEHHDRTEYIRMWWPMQDYWYLTGDRIKRVLLSADYRGALWDIWLNRDYNAYGKLEGRDFSLENWIPSIRMRLYVRKDTASWDQD